MVARWQEGPSVISYLLWVQDWTLEGGFRISSVLPLRGGDEAGTQEDRRIYNTGSRHRSFNTHTHFAPRSYTITAPAPPPPRAPRPRRHRLALSPAASSAIPLSPQYAMPFTSMLSESFRRGRLGFCLFVKTLVLINVRWRFTRRARRRSRRWPSPPLRPVRPCPCCRRRSRRARLALAS